MPINSSVIRAVMFGATACLFGGCSTPGSLTSGGQPASVNGSIASPAFTTSDAEPDFSNPAQPTLGARCRAFAPIFAEAAACQRANGTLDSFEKTTIAWRVRYFVRHWAMPCQEVPTVKEGYVFHMVTNDLYNDSDLNDTERIAIRNAMFDGGIHCKSQD